MPDEKRTQQVSLGCGTLILIALIVLIFSGRDGDLQREVQALRTEVVDLKKAVEGQTQQIIQLQKKLEQPTTGESKVN